MLLEWNAKISKKYVSKELSTEIHAKAAPFMKWLKEAEEEESSDEDEEDEIEVSESVLHLHSNFFVRTGVPSSVKKIMKFLNCCRSSTMTELGFPA